MASLKQTIIPTRTFVLDDHRVFANCLRDFLGGEQGIKFVGSAKALPDCLAQLAALQPDVLLVDPPLSDLKDGHTLRTLRVLWPRLAIVVLTLHDSVSHLKAALDAGADEFVGKDQVDVDLLPAIRRALAARLRQADGQLQWSPKSYN